MSQFGGKGKGKGGDRPPAKPSVINLDLLMDKKVRVKFTGGREGTHRNSSL
jgi:hypothetical protein